MVKSAVLFSSCSLVMAAIFAYSASVQLNDPDWYFWLPLYAAASAVNMVNWAISSKTIVRQIAKVTMWLGLLLFFKVVMEDFISGTAGFWSLDLSERVVREKTGSGLVIISLILQSMSTKKTKNKKLPEYVGYGMAILVTFTLGLPFVFFVVRNGEMKFDNANEDF